jgi:hypothetical protein
MPASRSRTQRWRDSLQKIHQRGGGLEFTADTGAEPGAGDLVWRVRLLDLSETDMVVEAPGAMGKRFAVSRGARLVGIMNVGQNRWMFHTRVLEVLGGPMPALRLEMPERVERCMRRSFDRVSTASLTLPRVECWTLRDPRSAVPCEVANRVRILDQLDSDILGSIGPAELDPSDLPDVGPKFTAELANIGGGGIGLRIARDTGPTVEGAHLFWLRIDLRPVVPTPLAVTARRAHTHIDSGQNLYAGMAFEFQLNPSHKAFVIDQIGRFFAAAQRRAAA